MLVTNEPFVKSVISSTPPIAMMFKVTQSEPTLFPVKIFYSSFAYYELVLLAEYNVMHRCCE